MRDRRISLVCEILMVFASAVLGNACFADDEFKIPFPTLSKETTVLTEPLDDDGFVDYLTALNRQAAEGVTPENNFEVVVREVMGDQGLEGTAEEYYRCLGGRPSANPEIRFILFEDFLLEKFPGDQQKSERQGQTEKLYELSGKLWSGEEYPLFEEWLKRNERALERIREGSSRPRSYCPLLTSGDDSLEIKLMQVRLPTLDTRRDIVRALSFSAMRKLHLGDREGSWNDLETIHRMARLTTQTKNSIEWLAGIGFESLALGNKTVFLRNVSLSSQKLKEMADEIHHQSVLPPPEQYVDQYWRYTFLEAMAKCYCMPETLKSLTNESVAAKQKTRKQFRTSVLDKQLKWGNLQFDRMVKIALIKDSVERTKAADQLMQAFEDSLKKREETVVLDYFTSKPADYSGVTVRNIVYAQTAPSLHLVGAYQRQIVRKGMTEIAFLLEAYRVDWGEYPQDLSLLVPDYIQRLPSDECSSKPLYYSRGDQSCLLVSFGLNQKDESTELSPAEREKGSVGDDIIIEQGTESK